MSRTGSILENYWDNKNLATVNSIDLESADELGINGNKSSFKLDLTKSLSSTSNLLSNTNAHRNNTMNGLFYILNYNLEKSFYDYWESHKAFFYSFKL